MVRGDEIARAVGRNVRERRLRRGWTQEVLAKLAGLSSSYIAAIERGEPQAVGFDVLGRLAENLEVPVAKLFTEFQTEGPGASDGALGPGPPAEEDQVPETEVTPEEGSKLHMENLELMGPLLGLQVNDPRLMALGALAIVWRGSEMPAEAMVGPDQDVDAARAVVRRRLGLPARKHHQCQLKICTAIDTLRPMVEDQPKYRIIEFPSFPGSKVGSFEFDRPRVVFEPRIRVGARQSEAHRFPRSLYALRVRRPAAIQVKEDVILARLVLLFASKWIPDRHPEVAWDRKIVPPPVRIFERMMIPEEITRDTPRTRDLDRIAQDVEAWARELHHDPSGDAFDQLVAWRHAIPHRRRVDRILRKMVP